ncbi:MAG: enoyl-CoA hydratase-related protein [Bdellovibrionales bacterium]
MKHLLLKEVEQVCTVTLNRPDKHNAFHPEMIRELTEVFQALEKRSDLRAVVLEGAGPSFSAGGDLEWMKSMVKFSNEENVADADRLFAMYQAMAECSLPLIGCVHGNVMGGGLGLVAVCDIVCAEVSTKFSFSEARIGIAPAVISPWVLRKCPQGLVREVMLSARVFSADEAKSYGLIHQVGRSLEIDEFMRSTLHNFSQCGPQAVREAKRLMNFVASQSWSLQRGQATKVIAERRASAEGQEGLKAFLEKRQPTWRSSRI